MSASPNMTVSLASKAAEPFPHQPENAPFRGDPSSSDWFFTFALALIALLPRLFVAIAASREPVWDAHYYHFGAERIAQGFGYSEDIRVLGKLVTRSWAHYPVGYSAALGLVYAVFGSGPLVGPIFGAIVGTALVVIVHRVARLILTENRARAAGTLAALHPGLIAYAAVLMTEPLAAVMILGALWARFSVLREKVNWVLVGVLTGLGALVRPLSLGVWAALLVAEKPPWRKALLGSIATLGIAFATILPWTLRNCSQMDGCALISTNGGWNLAIGAITKTGRFEALHGKDGCPVVTGQVQQDRCWAQVGWRKILKDPGAWLALAPKKLSQTYDHESFAIEYLHETAPELWTEGRRERGRSLLSAYHWLLISLGTLSVVAWPPTLADRSARLIQGTLLAGLTVLITYCWRNDFHPFYVLVTLLPILAILPLPGRPSAPRPLLSLLALLFITSVSHVVFFGEDRYHMVMSPVLCILAAACLRPGWLSERV
jgi:4-amino-4-deoxy-L-arabinose transferase-like glycosyltransferase